MVNQIKIKDRKYHFRTYKRCFLGCEAVDWLFSNTAARTREEALLLGQIMEERYVAALLLRRLTSCTRSSCLTLNCSGLIEHVTKDHTLKDEKLFYRVAPDPFRHLKLTKDGSHGSNKAITHTKSSVIEEVGIAARAVCYVCPHKPTTSCTGGQRRAGSCGSFDDCVHAQRKLVLFWSNSCGLLHAVHGLQRPGGGGGLLPAHTRRVRAVVIALHRVLYCLACCFLRF